MISDLKVLNSNDILSKLFSDMSMKYVNTYTRVFLLIIQLHKYFASFSISNDHMNFVET